MSIFGIALAMDPVNNPLVHSVWGEDESTPVNPISPQQDLLTEGGVFILTEGSDFLSTE